MASRPRYSEQAIDKALDGIGDIVTRLSERDIEVTSLIAGLALPIEKLESLVETLVVAGKQP